MKYMSFNSSCAYAALANMLLSYGVDAEDRDIALGASVPYMLACSPEEKAYETGAALQGPEWFNQYLNPIGFIFKETLCAKQEALSLLKPGSMVGLTLTPHKKHALVLLKKEQDTCVFLNNKWEDGPEPETLLLGEAFLLERMDNRTAVGRLERCLPHESLLNWDKLSVDLTAFMDREQEAETLRAAAEPLFRAPLLDGLTMMELIKNKEQTDRLKKLQGQYLKALRLNRSSRLFDFVSRPLLNEALAAYKALTSQKLASQ